MLIAYLYDKENNVNWQILEFEGFSVDSVKLNKEGSAKFKTSLTQQFVNSEFIKLNRRVVLKQSLEWVEKTLFDWIIKGRDVDFKTIELQLWDRIFAFQNKVLYSNYSYTNETIDNILQEQLDAINARENTFISLDCWISQQITKTYNKGDTFLSILKDIAELWFEFVVEDMVLKFKENVWTDRTWIWNNFLEFRYDLSEPTERNIDSWKNSVSISSFCNAVIFKDNASSSEEEDATSISIHWRVENSVSNSGSTNETASWYIEQRKEQTNEVSFKLETSDFFAWNLGDIVKIYIQTGSDLFQFDGTSKIVSKSFTSWDLNEVSFWLSASSVQSPDMVEYFRKLQERIKLLEMK